MKKRKANYQKEKKSFFSNKGNSDDYNYMEGQLKIFGILAVFFVAIFLLVKCGVV